MMTFPNRSARFAEPRLCRLKNSQYGITLMEIMAAMFVLAVGLSALLASQIRSVSAVREAEAQTVVSRLTQNLTEGMHANPEIAAQTDSDGRLIGKIKKSYPHYWSAPQTAAACASSFGQRMSKAHLAAQQICRFSNDLAAALPDYAVHFAVCRDNSGKPPIFDGTSFKAQCSNRGNMTAVKIAWIARSAQNSQTPEAYTYQVMLPN